MFPWACSHTSPHDLGTYHLVPFFEEDLRYVRLLAVWMIGVFAAFQRMHLVRNVWETIFLCDHSTNPMAS